MLKITIHKIKVNSSFYASNIKVDAAKFVTSAHYGHRVYGGSEHGTCKHIENPTLQTITFCTGILQHIIGKISKFDGEIMSGFCR